MPPVRTSVVIPTIGRPALLRETLASIGACTPAADEVVVVDQSSDPAVTRAVEEVVRPSATYVRSAGRGRGLAVNEGLRAARGELVLMTDDDCTVREDWVGAGAAAMAGRTRTLLTGRVLPAGDPGRTPSTITAEVPAEYEHELRCDVLYAGNMACRREELLAIGAFDPAIVPSAEDCDLCYRWLKAGGTIRFEPELCVWHHDWRTPEELASLYRRYYVGQGVFYAKHLVAGDRGVLPFVRADLRSGVRIKRRQLRAGLPAWGDPRTGILPGLLIGLGRGALAAARAQVK